MAYLIHVGIFDAMMHTSLKTLHVIVRFIIFRSGRFGPAD